MPHNQAIPMAFMVSIVTRGQGDKLACFLTENGTVFNFMTLGHGTANKKILNYLGLGETKKDVLFSAVSYRQLPVLLEAINDSEFNLKAPGHGIAFCIPVNSAAVTAAEGGASMGHPYDHDLVVAITTLGYADEVMNAARHAGATGGTILKGRGAGAEKAAKFFGITIQPEKEFVFMVIQKTIRPAVMLAITSEQGMHTEANTIVFSLPVSDIAGISFDNPELRPAG